MLRFRRVAAESEALVRKGVLSLKMLDYTFRWMAAQQQPRLTRTVANVQKYIRQRIMHTFLELHKECVVQSRPSMDQKHIFGEDADDACRTIRDTDEQCGEVVKSQGLPYLPKYNTGAVAASAVGVAVGGGVTTTVALRASAYAVAGLCAVVFHVLFWVDLVQLPLSHTKYTQTKNMLRSWQC